MARTVDEIWADDLLNRRSEAQDLIAYIESAVGRPSLHQDKKAFTIAIDARYGEGKSFFIKRLSENLQMNHPVAFVDAWADDLADEPLTALVATLKRALDPFVDQPEVQARLKTFMAKSGKIIKIVGLGVARRGAGMLITGAAVDAVGDVITSSSEAVAGAIADSAKDIGQGTVDDIRDGLSTVTAHSLMEKRVSSFEEGQSAIRDLKESLESIVSSLEKSNSHPPIIIIIDELDRCRPTYAVKLLEEIKHLFDVPGLVFILSMHSNQLSHSISGAYGSGFDGKSYLRRFIDRQYHLAEPELEPFLSALCMKMGLDFTRIRYPHIGFCGGGGVEKRNLPWVLARYMEAYGLGARDAFQLLDILQTAISLSNNEALYAAYLIPLIIGQIQGLPSGTLPNQIKYSWSYHITKDHFGREFDELNFDSLAQSFYDATQLSDGALSEQRNSPKVSLGVRAVSEMRRWNTQVQPLGSVDSYPRLLAKVARFENPKIG